MSEHNEALAHIRKRVRRRSQIFNWGFTHEDGSFSNKIGVPCYAAVSYCDLPASKITGFHDYIGYRSVRTARAEAEWAADTKRERGDYDYDKSKWYSPTPKESREYYTWLANESGYAACMVTKDAKEAHKFGVEYDVEYPAPYIIGAGMSQRLQLEYRGMVAAWGLLAKGGINKDFALIATHFIKTLDGDEYKDHWIINSEGGGAHKPFDFNGWGGETSVEGVQNFVAHEMPTHNSVTTRDFEPIHEDREYDGVAMFFNDHPSGEGEEVKFERPVKQKVVHIDGRYGGHDYKTVSGDQLIAQVKKWEKEYV